MTVVPEALIKVFAANQDRRRNRAAKMWSLLKPRDQRLVREAAVMGFVQGSRWGQSHVSFEEKIPGDAEIVEQVLIAFESFPDLYPTFRRLGRRADRAV